MEPFSAGGMAAFPLKLLQDQLLLCVMAELVGAEKVAVIEGREVVDVDLSGLGENETNGGSTLLPVGLRRPPKAGRRDRMGL